MGCYGRTLVTLGVLLAAGAIGAQESRSYSPVTDARLESPEARNWLMYLREYSSWSYSPLNRDQHAQRRGPGARLDDVDGHDRGPSGAADRQRRRHVRHDAVQPSARDRRQDRRPALALSASDAGRHPHGPPDESRRRALRRQRLHGDVGRARRRARRQNGRRRLEQGRRELQRRLLHDDCAARRARSNHGRRLGRRARHSRLRRRARRATPASRSGRPTRFPRPASPATTPGPATRGAPAARPCGSRAASIPSSG